MENRRNSIDWCFIPRFAIEDNTFIQGIMSRSSGIVKMIGTALLPQILS